MMDRDERLAMKMAGTAVSRLPSSGLSAAIMAAQSDVERLYKEGAPAKEMAVALRYVAMLTLLDNLGGEDKRLANDAAKEILSRSDGRAGADAPVNVQVNNVLNVGIEDLARRLEFLDRLRGRVTDGEIVE